MAGSDILVGVAEYQWYQRDAERAAVLTVHTKTRCALGLCMYDNKHDD